MSMCTYGVPSCVISGTIAENACFLDGKVAEIALCFFETKSCLAYQNADLPLHLASLNFKWHIHLPFDLPWNKGGAESAYQALALVEKVKFLNPYLAVLHPPSLKNKSILLHDFIKIWNKYSNIPILLENISDCALIEIKDVIIDDNFKVCLDIAHALSFKHYDLLKDVCLLEKVQLVHWSAPGKNDQHLSLAEFTISELEDIKSLIKYLPRSTAHLLEIFNWKGIEPSILILDNILKFRA